MSDINEILDEFTEMPDEWDGYGAEKISISTIEKVKEVLKNLQDYEFDPTPTPDGGVSLEAKSDGYYIEISIGKI